MIQKNEFERLVKEMFKAGIIQDNNSSFASLMVFVKKKDRSWRLCVDDRQLNKLTIKNKFLISLLEELLDELVHVIYFSKLNLRADYHQIRMKNDIHKTTFQTH